VAKGRTLVLSSIPPRTSADVGPVWADLAELTCATHRKYCERHGYEYHLDVSDIWETHRPTRRGEASIGFVPIKYKIKFLLFQHFLDPDACGQEYDHVVWLDSDLVITNYDIPLEKFFNSKLAADGIGENGMGFVGDIILSYDCNGLHATVIMMRRSSQTLGFAYANGEAGMRYHITDDWSDQLTMRMFLATPPYQWLPWFHSVKTLCAQPPGIYTHTPERARKPYEWSEGDFALHLSALPIAKRIELAQEWIEKYDLL
jgi:hypothetical protein